MVIPTYAEDRIIDEEGKPLPGFISFIQNLIQNMQLSLSDEGYLIPSVTDAQKLVIQNSFQTTVVNPSSQTVSTGVRPGTMVFDTETANGGSPNGQLWVLLNDGVFHPVTNT